MDNNRVLDSTKQGVLDGLKRGESYSEISEHVKVGVARIKVIIRELKERGFITEEQIKQAREKRKQWKKEHTEENKEETIDENLKNKVLGWLKYGFTTQKICRILNITNQELQQIKDLLIKEGKISKDGIRLAVENRLEQDKEIVYKHLCQGDEYKVILVDLPYATLSYVARLVDMLKKENKITGEEIERAKFERYEKEKLEYICQGLLQGFSWKEIIEGDKSKNLTEQQVETRQKKLLEAGIITKEQIEAARKKRMESKKAENQENYEGPHDKRILQLLKLGFNGMQVAQIVGVGESYVSKRKRELELKGKITKEEISMAIENREKRADIRRKKLERMKRLAKDVDIEIFQEHIEYARAKDELKELKMSDVRILSDVIEIEPKLIVSVNIKFILLCFTRAKKYDAAIAFLNQCIECLDEEDDRESSLLKAKNEIMLSKSKMPRKSAKTRVKTGVRYEGDGR